MIEEQITQNIYDIDNLSTAKRCSQNMLLLGYLYHIYKVFDRKSLVLYAFNTTEQNLLRLNILVFSE
jgi:hypothetical protein